MNAASTSPTRHFPVIRVFVSSTFSDLVAERNALAEKVWPELESYCRQRGFTFQAIDLRWGVPSEAGLDHRTMQICFEELHRAQEASPEPNFLILLGEKYGWRPLPETISEAEYARLFEHAQSPEEQRTLEDWYRRDANAIPPHHILRARTDSPDSPDSQDYTRVPDADGRLRDTDAWLAVQETLWAIVNRKGAYPASLLRERFAEGTDVIPASVRFQGSATEQEIWNGALKVENARDHVVAWFRDIDRTLGDPEPSQLKRFLDLKPDQSPDLDAAVALNELKTQVEQTLAPEPILHAQCSWAIDAGGAFTGEVSTDHIAPMCESILTRLRALILRQINDYWGIDLSADDATVGVVHGTQQELDLELRDHQRFAQERGPVDGFVGRDEQVRTLRDYLHASTNRPLILHGPSGSGKTALLAYVAQQPFPPGTEAGGVSPLILTRFIGAHPESSTLRGLMSSLCRELRMHFPIAEPLPDTLQKLTEEFYVQLSPASAEQPIFVFLDALDQLEAADQARDCFWLRSQILPQAGEAPCYARIVASCLSPSPEFPPESEACVPFRRLQTRGLLADEELGALSEMAACKLLRQWLVIQKRGLTEDQWKHVDVSIRESSERRQPLYLRTLHEQLRGWREFDEPMPLPASLSLLIEETLDRLCQPNQHGLLARIALGYLVSARYGLSEGELLEVLLRDPDMQAQIGEAEKNYGHSLPPKAKSYPVAPWARLRSDLRAYLSERAAPGTTVLSCYHRQVELAVRELFLADEAIRTERRRLLADYFDTRWDQPDAHALMELPDLLLALPDHRRLYNRLTNFAFPMRKAEAGLLETVLGDYTRLSNEGPADLRAPLRIWHDFVCKRSHILRRGVADQSVHKILLQLALEHADDSPVTTAAETWLSAGRCDWLRLQRVPRLEHLTPNSCRAVLEGHTARVIGALLKPDRRILSWGDKTLRLWDAATGDCRAVLSGHTSGVKGVLPMQEGRLLSWSGDKTLRVWDATDGACLAVLEGHKEDIKAAVLLPGDQILSWSNDKTLRLWEAATGVCRAVLEGHTDSIRCALPLAEGLVLSWSNDKTLRLWDAAARACRAVLLGHTNDIRDAVLLPDGQILSWSNDGTLRLWDAATGACEVVFKGHKLSVIGARLLQQDQLLSWSIDGTLRLWDTASGACDAILKGHTNSVSGVLLLSERQILSWSMDGTLRLWDSATGACNAILKGHTHWVSGALLLPEGQILSWSHDKTLRLWDAETGDSKALLEGHTKPVVGALALSDGRIVSWAENGDWSLRVWDVATGDCKAVLEGHTMAIEGALALPDGQIISWSGDRTLRVWDAAIGGRGAVPQEPTNTVRGALSLPKGRLLSWSDDTLRLWDADNGSCCAVIEGHGIGIRRPLLLPDGNILSCTARKTLQVWNSETGACRALLEGHKDWIQGAQLQPDGQILSWSEDGTLLLWDASTGACRAMLEGHTRQLHGALSLPDGRILSWSDDKTLRIWDAVTGACCAILNGHSSSVHGALPLPGSRILSWSEDATLRVWDAVTAECRTVLEGHKSGVYGALRLNDGRIVSRSSDKTLRVWDASTGTCIAVMEGQTDWLDGAVALADSQILSWPQWINATIRRWDASTGACLEVVTGDDLLVRHPDWLHLKRMVEQPWCIAGNWGVDARGRTARLYHRLGITLLPAWQADSDSKALLVQPDGTFVVTQANSQVCILKLHHGNRRVTLAEAEEILQPGGK